MSKAEFSSMIIGHQDFLRQLAMKLTKSSDDSDDLIQETLFKALKNREKFQEGTNIKGWLYTIMKNTFINAYRKRKNQNTFVDETENQYFINLSDTDNAPTTDSIVDHKYMLSEVNSIDKTYLETFMMYYNGYKYEEISEILDIPLGTVKSRIFLARRKMMDKLKDYR